MKWALLLVLPILCLIVWYLKGWLFLCRYKEKAFDRAWFMHQKRAFHHWQSWTFPDTNGKLRVLPIPDRYCREMLADWRGAARAQGLTRESVVDWYAANKDKIILHPTTQAWIENMLYKEVQDDTRADSVSSR